MKRLFLLAYFLPLVALAAEPSAYSDSLTYVLEQLRHDEGELISFDASGKLAPGEKVSFVGGRNLGYSGGVHGTFVLLIPYFRNRATFEDIELMLKDKSAAVRIMGAYLVLTDDKFEGSPPARKANAKRVGGISLKLLESDNTSVQINTGGCITEGKSVAEVVQLIRQYPGLFGERSPQQESETK